MAHQHVGQLSAVVREAIFGNVGTIVAFRVGIREAAALSGALYPSTLTMSDYIELPNYQAIAQVFSGDGRSPASSLATSPACASQGLEWALKGTERV